MDQPCCPSPHNPDEVRSYVHLPKVVLPRCRFVDADYMTEITRRHPHTTFIAEQPNPLAK